MITIIEGFDCMVKIRGLGGLYIGLSRGLLSAYVV